jgi:hypothetical protein
MVTDQIWEQIDNFMDDRRRWVWLLGGGGGVGGGGGGVGAQLQS